MLNRFAGTIRFRLRYERFHQQRSRAFAAALRERFSGLLASSPGYRLLDPVSLQTPSLPLRSHIKSLVKAAFLGSRNVPHWQLQLYPPSYESNPYILRITDRINVSP